MRAAWILLFACEQEPPPPVDAADVRYGAESVKSALDRLSSQEEPPASPTDEAVRLEALEDRIGKLELTISELQTQGVVPAENVSFDPRATKLGGTEVQSALTELEKRVAAAEEKLGQDMGQPGPGLFEVRGKRGAPGPGPPGPGAPPPGSPPPQGH